MKRWIFLGIGLFMVSLGVFALDVAPTNNVVVNGNHFEHVIWNKIPISFVVPVGQERILSFPGSVEIHNTNRKLTTDKISILNNEGTLYIKAKKAFSAIRIPIVVENKHEAVLVDLSAKANTDDTPVSVLFSGGNDGKAESTQSSSSAAMNYVKLMRYAIQHLYSPLRIVHTNFNIARTPMYTSRTVDLVYGDNVMAMPLISWRGGNLYVTAVLLKNTWKQRIALDPRNLKGNWLAASFYPSNFVAPMGGQHDRTTLFVISARPFNDALNGMKEYRP